MLLKEVCKGVEASIPLGHYVPKDVEAGIPFMYKLTDPHRKEFTALVLKCASQPCRC
jgi:hypothetical protein